MFSILLLSFALPQQDPQTLLSDATWQLPHLGTQVREIRWWDEAAGTILSRATLPDGTEVDAYLLRQKNHQVGRQLNGKLSPELAEIVAETNPNDFLHVVFWLETRDAPDWRAVLDQAMANGMDGESARIFARDEAASFFAPRIQHFTDWCSNQGFEVTQALSAWPVVYAKLPAKHVRAAAGHDLVDEAYFCFPDAFPELDNAQGTMRTPIVWDSGMTAAGSPVKTMINDVDQVTTSNPYLPNIIKIYGGSGVGSHASAVAGNIAMNHSARKGAAYGIPNLYTADGYGDSGAPSSWNAAISNGVSFGNCSWWNGSKGKIVYLDRFFDYTIRNYSVMMFKSTGNQGPGSGAYTTTPGNGYNSTNSGCYSDNNNTSWSGDAMASYSSYLDPAEGHEKPELASPGDDVDTTGTSTYYSGFNGTSSASPLTCGVATLMATRDNALMTKPEVVKSVLMASAWHNIEGNDVLSEKDGAGGVHALAADSVLARGNYHSATLTSADFQNSFNSYDITIPAAAGQEVRVCGLWFSKANSSYSTDVLDMDLDLYILDPMGNSIAQSANAYNAFEILKFTASVSGYHTARLVKKRFNGTTEPFCLSWSDRLDSGEAEVRILGTPKVGSSFTLELDTRYSPSQWFELRVSGSTFPRSVDIGSGYVLPLANDGAFAWSTNQSNFSGSLDSAGQANITTSIPNNPNLANRSFWVAMFVKPSATSSTVNTVSHTASLTILP
ncbi:MAG TPA: S8 family serine peptidase [Planctomycetota bacterium]|nr:S8 family serine peptidase [Planctomycetota bacterium]